MSVLYAKSLMSQQLPGETSRPAQLAVHHTRKAGTAGESQRQYRKGNRLYCQSHGGYTTWEMLLADGNSVVRHRIATYNVVRDSVPGQAKLSSGSISLELSESEPQMKQVFRR